MKLSGSSGEGLINHYGLVRMRLRGSGNLLMRLLSLDEVKEFVLAPFVMQVNTDIEPTRLSNFTQQRAQLEIKTTVINETFQISRIVIFSKQVATSYPG